MQFIGFTKKEMFLISLMACIGASCVIFNPKISVFLHLAETATYCAIIFFCYLVILKPINKWRANRLSKDLPKNLNILYYGIAANKAKALRQKPLFLTDSELTLINRDRENEFSIQISEIESIEKSSDLITILGFQVWRKLIVKTQSKQVYSFYCINANAWIEQINSLKSKSLQSIAS